MILVLQRTKYDNHETHEYKEDISFEIMQHIVLVNFMNIGTF